MEMQLRILLPVDFSAENEVMFQMVEHLSQRLQIEVTLLHVLPTGKGLEQLAARLTQGLMAREVGVRAHEALEKLQALPYFAHCASTHVMLLAKGGTPAKEIARLANREGFDLIITSGKFRRGAAEYLVGSTLSKLLRLSPVPVLTLSPGHLPRLGRILFATDFSPSTTRALIYLLRIAHTLQATFYCVRINTSHNFCTERDFKEHVRDTLQVVQDNNLDIHLTVDNFISYNDRSIHQGIITCAQDHHIDLVVMATHARSGLDLMMNGSHTQDVIEHTHLPVLIFRVEQVEVNMED